MRGRCEACGRTGDTERCKICEEDYCPDCIDGHVEDHEHDEGEPDDA